MCSFPYKFVFCLGENSTVLPRDISSTSQLKTGLKNGFTDVSEEPTGV